MSRSSISFTPPNDEWIKSQIASEEYNSKREVINDLIRKARKEQDKISYIRAKLIASEKSGSTDLTRDEILEKSKEELLSQLRLSELSGVNDHDVLGLIKNVKERQKKDRRL